MCASQIASIQQTGISNENETTQGMCLLEIGDIDEWGWQQRCVRVFRSAVLKTSRHSISRCSMVRADISTLATEPTVTCHLRRSTIRVDIVQLPMDAYLRRYCSRPLISIQTPTAPDYE